MIHRGELRPGDRLSPERELAPSLSVSRQTLSDGPPALDSSPLRLMASLHDFIAAEMFEAGRVLEMCGAGLAAEHATGEQLAAMSEEVAGMYASLNDPERHLAHDIRFHQAVAAASGNRILAALMEMATTAHSEVLRRMTNRSSELKVVMSEHQEIYRAIRGRDAEGAREAMG